MARQIICGWLAGPPDVHPWKWKIPRSSLPKTTVYLRVHLPRENIARFVCLYFKKIEIVIIYYLFKNLFFDQ